jgi:hypothetical protein
MILEIQSNAGQINDRLDASLLQLRGVTNTTSLKDQWRRQRASRNNDHLPCSKGAGLLLLGGTLINHVCFGERSDLRMGGEASLEQFGLQLLSHFP